MSGAPRPAALRSPIGRLILLGEQIVMQAIISGRCPLLSCGGEGGQHAAGCLIGEALTFDPLVRRRAQIAREDRDRG